MAQRTRFIQSSFAGGTLSPRVLGRVDMDKYYASAEVVRDLIVMPQGGLKRRPGTQRVAQALGPSRLIPFVFSPNVAYIIELGNKSLNIYYAYNDQAQSPSGSFQPPYTAGAKLPISIVTPYDTSVINLWDIQFAQQGDELYLVHPSYPMQKLIRYGVSGAVPSYSDTNWRLVQPVLKCPPIDQFDIDYSAGVTTMSPSATSGTAVNFIASTNFFIAGDVARFIFNTVDGGLAQIVSITSPTVAVC